MFLSRLRVLPLLFLFFSVKTTFYVCGGFFGLWPKILQTAKAHKTFFRSPHSFVWFGMFTIRLSFISFFSIIRSTSTKGRSRLRVRLVSRCCDRRKTSPRSRGKRGGKIILFLRAKKRKLLPSSSSVVVVWSLLCYNYLWIIFARAPLLLVLFCSFIAFSWFKPSSRRRREESSSLVVPSSLFHSHALSFITLKKQAPSWSVDRSLLQTEDTQFIFVHFLNKVKKRIIKRNVL